MGPPKRKGWPKKLSLFMYIVMGFCLISHYASRFILNFKIAIVPRISNITVPRFIKINLFRPVINAEISPMP